jgi:hypothetical protein
MEENASNLTCYHAKKQLRKSCRAGRYGSFRKLIKMGRRWEREVSLLEDEISNQRERR